MIPELREDAMGRMRPLLAEEEAAAVIKNHGIDEMVFFPAGFDLLLDDGRTLRFWEGSYEYGREWEWVCTSRVAA